MELKEIARVPMVASGSLNVIDEKDAIHCLENDPRADEKALSIHLYSKPISTCAVFDVNTGRCSDHTLVYDSISGKPVVGFQECL